MVKKVLTDHTERAIIHPVKNNARMCGRAGDNSEGGTPVPIPNTVVKPFSSYDTVWATARENRTSPSHPPIPGGFVILSYILHCLQRLCQGVDIFFTVVEAGRDA